MYLKNPRIGLQILQRLFMFNMVYIVVAQMIKLYNMQENFDRKIIICDMSAYNMHPDYRPDFRRKKCVLYAENYGIWIHMCN